MSNRRICTVVGARPQIIKAAAVSPSIRPLFEETIIHTGQHYDYDMSESFFEELGLPTSKYNLEVRARTHGDQTAQIMSRMEPLLVSEKPDAVIVYGDTNSTLAAAVTAAKLGIPVVHVEAGLRSYRRSMPEELNRIVADHVSDLLLAPSHLALENLVREGLGARAQLVGDVMYDLLTTWGGELHDLDAGLAHLGLRPRQYVMLTLHRDYNVDYASNLRSVLSRVALLGCPVVFPVHPRTRARLSQFALEELISSEGFICTGPLEYTRSLMIQSNARAIITDSGGIQKEAYWLGIPCFTVRNETEWGETVQCGANVLVGDSGHDLVEAFAALGDMRTEWDRHAYGDGKAVDAIVRSLVGFFS